MSTPVALPIDPRLQEMAAVIHGVIPGAEVRLFGSQARGTAGPESDIDRLITASDGWLENFLAEGNPGLDADAPLSV